MFLPITFCQPLDASGSPQGPILWVCHEIGHAGRILTGELATDDVVAAKLQFSLPDDYDHIWGLMLESGELQQVVEVEFPQPKRTPAVIARVAIVEIYSSAA